jgi:hypothetical protein
MFILENLVNKMRDILHRFLWKPIENMIFRLNTFSFGWFSGIKLVRPTRKNSQYLHTWTKRPYRPNDEILVALKLRIESTTKSERSSRDSWRHRSENCKSAWKINSIAVSHR